MKKISFLLTFVVLIIGLSSCKEGKSTDEKENQTMDLTQEYSENNKMQQKVNEYAKVKLTSNLENISDDQREMLVHLLEASQIMDTLFWYQAYGNAKELLDSQTDSAVKEFIEIHYGPWDRLDNDKSFVKGIDEKPKGANFYPSDMTKEEFNKADLPDKESLYTFLRRDDEGKLYTLAYHEKFKDGLERASELLRKAADLAEDKGFSHYLKLRADALLNDQFKESDLAWMDMKDNEFDIVIGPVETYEDQLFGYKSSYEATLLHKDIEWSKKLAKYAAFLPELQNALPVEEKYKQEKPGTDADLNAYDIIFYAGSSNAGGKTIAINLPNDEEVQLEKGTRRLQLKNAMQAKFDKILVPIAEVLITPGQRKHVVFDAFFTNTMFHEVAHGLGINNTITNKGTVRKALQEHASALEEGKADILGLFMVEQLLDKGEIQGDIKDYYVTFIAGIFRSVRFGAGSAHGAANMVRFNYFKDHQAFERLEDGAYKVNYDKMKEAIRDLSNLILTLQGEGDYEGVDKLVKEKGKIGNQLQKDLDRLQENNIPVDIVFEQGKDVLGL